MNKLVGQGSKYTDDQRRQAVLQYSIYSSLAKVSESTGIPRKTLSDWRRSEWWDQLSEKLRQYSGEPTSAGEVLAPKKPANYTGRPMCERGSKYTDSDRRAAVLQYAILGNMSKVSKALNIPKTTLCEWKQSDWWVSLTNELRIEKGDAINAQLDQIIDLAYSETIDRLKNGDIHVNAGEVTRAPIKAKDAAWIGSVGFDKRQLSFSRPTSITGKSEGMQALLEQFEQLARESREKVVSEQ